MVLVAIYLLLFVIDCHFSNYPILNTLHTEYFTEMEVLISLHDSASGYNGILEMLVVYTLPFLFGYYYVSDKESPCNMIRYTSRDKYKQMEIKKMMIVAVMFTFLHQFIDFIYTVKNFKWSLLMEHPFVTYIIIAGVIAALFYVQTGLVYHIFNDWLKNDWIALVMVLLINFMQYICIKRSVFISFLPAKDLSVAFEFFDYRIDMKDVLFVLLKNIITTICLFLASKMIFEKKDVLKNEK